MDHTKLLTVFISNYLNVIKTKSTWGKLQLRKEFYTAVAKTITVTVNDEATQFMRVVCIFFNKDISTKTTWGKNQVEMFLHAAIASAALMKLDNI